MLTGRNKSEVCRKSRHTFLWLYDTTYENESLDKGIELMIESNRSDKIFINSSGDSGSSLPSQKRTTLTNAGKIKCIMYSYEDDT